MPKITPLSARKIVKLLIKLGFKPVRQKGSHLILMDKKRRRVVVPIHPGKKVKPGLIRGIIKEVEISREKFFKLLKEV